MDLTKIYIKIAIAFGLLALCAAGCTPVVKDGSLLVSNAVVCDNSLIDVDEPLSYVRQLPSSTVFGMAVHARIYNSVPQQKADSIKAAHVIALDSINRARIREIRYQKGYYLDHLKDLRLKIPYYIEQGDRKYVKELVKDSCKSYRMYRRYVAKDSFFTPKAKIFSFPLFWQNIGEKPSVYDSIQTVKSLEQIRLYMQTKGFYESTVTYTKKERRHKTFVTYNIKAGTPIRIGTIDYKIDDDTIAKYVLLDTAASLIKTGGVLDVDVLQNERSRISDALKQIGYYNFRKDYIEYTVDTLIGNHQADIVLEVLPVTMENGKTARHRRFYISNINVYPNYDATKEILDYDNYYDNMRTYYSRGGGSAPPVTFYYQPDTFRIKPRVITKEIFVKAGELYNQSSVTDTYKHLSAFNVFKMVEVNFDDHTMSKDSLNCNIYLTPSKPQEFVYGIGATNTSGNIGASFSNTYRNKNIFNGAETFDLRYLMSWESQTSFNGEQNAFDLNTQEYGLESRLYFPRMLAPRFLRMWTREKTPRTNISLMLNYRRRPDYTRSMINLNLNYQFADNKYLSSTVTPVRLSSIKISNADQAFLDWLDRLFIKDSYQDHFILGSGYSFVFNNQSAGKRSYHYVKFNLSWAGNMLTLASRALHREKNENGSYDAPLMHTTYAQFVKTDVDYRHYLRTIGSNIMVFRMFAGLGIPYGNINFMPFTEQYFSGGANSLRAWQIRSVGPGSFDNSAAVGINSKYPNMTSDMKLEANLEYRFKLFWVVEGAWFFDAGNIWSINRDDKREGGDFDVKRFYKEIAVGSGLGLRLDFDFFLFRADFGLKLRDPSLKEGERWLAKNDHSFIFRGSNWAFCLGIGYPF
ncbi:MAG: BamA/TamA family outer membrane protein [Bacteroidales bacterium]|nr:BamA/TamA family outer membrane protein [Bacteroidales bacterium]